MQTYRVAVLAYPGCMPTQLFGIVDVLRIAADVAQDDKVRVAVQIVAPDGAAVAVAGGMKLAFPRPRGKFDVLIVPGMEITRHADWSRKLAGLQREAQFLRKAFQRGTQIASVCIGAFLLGEAGLLRERRATTSWLFSAQLAARYPQTRVDADAVVIEDGGITTSAAVSSIFDLALHLIRRFYGAAVAAATARTALLDTNRDSQTPYVDKAMLPSPAPSFSTALADWFAARLSAPYDLARVAQSFHISPRTLMRRVKEETGDSPLSLLQRARVERAQHLLVQTRSSVASVTESVGYVDQVSFDRLFQRHVGMSMAAWRRKFQTASSTKAAA